MRLALVSNAKSGSEDMADAVLDALREAGADVQPVGLEEFCGGPDSIDDDRMAAVARGLRGLERIVVAGGDGSIGPAAALAACLGVPVAVVPTGTANDFARFLDLPLDAADAARLAADSSARIRTVELARAAGRRPFVNAASTGLSVLAAANARPLKARLGPLAYAVGAIRAGLTGGARRLTVRCDGDVVFRGRTWQVVVAATGAFGGGSGTGGVDQHDHRLDVAIVEAGPRIKLLRRAIAMKRQRLVDDPAVRHVRGRVVEIDGARTFNVDGEVLQLRPARFGIDGSVEVVVP